MHDQKGFTLIELLIAIMLSMAALAAGYSIFFGSGRAVTMQTQDSRMQDNARMAMDVIARNFRKLGLMVKFAKYPPGTTICRAGVAQNCVSGTKLIHLNSSAGPDEVMIVGANTGWQAPLKNSAASGDNVIKLSAADVTQIANQVSSTGSAVLGLGLVHTARVNGTSGDSVTLNDSIPAAKLTMALPGQTGSGGGPSNQQVATVMLVTTTRFNIAPDPTDNTIPILYQDGQPLAEGIEDLQIEYGVDINNDRIIQAAEWSHDPATIPVGGGFMGGATDMRENIRLVRVTIVARTDREDPALRGIERCVPSGTPPACAGSSAGDRPAWLTIDGYRRFVLTRIIKCRNMDLVDTL